MIKVCSLDFVHKETFEADIMNAEGGLLCAASEDVTAAKILKLYFKEIYINESSATDISKTPHAGTTTIHSNEKNMSIPKIANSDLTELAKDEKITEPVIEETVEITDASTAQDMLEKAEAEEILAEKTVDTTETIETDNEIPTPENLNKAYEEEKEEVLAEQAEKTTESVEAESEKVTAEVLNKVVEEKTEVSDTSKEPVAASESTKTDSPKITARPAQSEPEKESPAKAAPKGPMAVNTSTAHTQEDKETKGPRAINSEITHEIEETAAKGPIAADITDKYSREDSAETKRGPRATEDKVFEEPKPVVDENPPLTFDENQAKRIVNASIKLGKIFNYSPSELKELEQVAYYCNIGITEFRKNDLQKKDFRKRKILTSYNMLSRSGQVTDDIAQIIKSCASPYESDSFPLNSKIPYYHIVAITNCYEDLLAQSQSKDATLIKMLQMGGNHFNIFVLHKFIKLMKDSNE